MHRIDPILASIGGVHLWWYGLSYAAGFMNLHLYLRHQRRRLGLSLSDVYSLTLYLAVGVLAGGRIFEVAFDEWPFYREHLLMVPAYWLGGMATHGLLVGALGGVTLFTWATRRPFLEIADALVIPGALLMGVGRIGNFIDGLIVGTLTEMPWGVQFPEADGFRHPVVLYDGGKNLLLIPYLMWVRRTNATPGAMAARFVFWYAFPRIFIDMFRDYPTHRLALGTGQTLNLVMALVGAILLARSRLRRLGRLAVRKFARPAVPISDAPAPVWKPAVFAATLAFCLTIPSNWTQDVPDRYSHRHAGLEHSWIYPYIDSSPRRKSVGDIYSRPANGR